MSVLNPQASIGIGLATAGLVGYFFQKGMPGIADIRVAESQNADINATNRQALWTSAAAVGVVSLIAKDPTIAVIGGGMAVTLYWIHAHANLVSPLTGKAVQELEVPDMPAETQEQDAQAYGYAGDLN